MDGNPLPRPIHTPGLWLGTAELAIVQMSHPGVGSWATSPCTTPITMASVEYAGYKGKLQWLPPHPFKWNYAHFGIPNPSSAQPDETFDMLFEKNAALDGFNQWTINGVA